MNDECVRNTRKRESGINSPDSSFIIHPSSFFQIRPDLFNGKGPFQLSFGACFGDDRDAMRVILIELIMGVGDIDHINMQREIKGELHEHQVGLITEGTIQFGVKGYRLHVSIIHKRPEMSPCSGLLIFKPVRFLALDELI